jgi:hypothetical protein
LLSGWPKLKFVGLKTLYREILDPATAGHNTNNWRKLHDSGRGEYVVSASVLVRRDDC